MKKNKNSNNKVIKVIGGAIIGLINGFFGGGGGMVCVPYLEKYFGLDNKKSHATALLVILPLSVASLCVYMFNNEVDYYSALFIGIGAICGGILGSILLKKLNGNIVRIIFASLMIIAGLKMVISW